MPSTNTKSHSKRTTHKSNRTDRTDIQPTDYTCKVSVIELKKKEKLIQDLKSTKKNLETEKNHLQEQVKNLETEKNHLQEQVKFLETNNKTLFKDLERIQNQVRYLEQENKNLSFEKQKMKKKDKDIKTVAKEMYNLSLKNHEVIGDTYEKLLDLSIN